MRKLKGSQERTSKRSIFPFKKLTLSGCRMFRSAGAEASNDGFSMLATHGHASSGSPSTHLFSLCDRSHSLQARRASRLTESLGARVPHI
jgi:hypothetical protein